MIGLVAVTAFGMTLANSRLAGLNELRKFKEDIAVLLVSGVFVVRTVLDFITRHGFAPFAWWRIVVGVGGLIALNLAR